LTVADGDNVPLGEHRDALGSEVRWVKSDDISLGGDWLDALGLQGLHNRRNATIARACLLALGVPEAHDNDALARAAEGYEGLDSRLRTIGTVRGVTFVDDSLSTNVLPTLAALEAFADHRVALIVGGHDRGIDYEPLAEYLSGRAEGSVAVFTLPENGPRIGAAVRAGGRAEDGGEAGGRASSGARSVPETVDCAGMDEAVDRALAWASGSSIPAGSGRSANAGGAGGSAVGTRPGVVLLSPAAPSCGHFRNYKERASAFAGAMRRCAG
jgi:UDP-N-acetylmuramoylalanine--D-glutamate ligase